VDDEPILHELYRDILELKGHKVMGEAFDGDECFNMITDSERTPDFIIMDHRMPVRNGLEATKMLLKMNPNLKIIFISADLSIKDEALKSGAVSFIKKPFNITTLFESVEELLAFVEKRK
jgi:two-component system chemotaxis response regulator CheY